MLIAQVCCTLAFASFRAGLFARAVEHGLCALEIANALIIPFGRSGYVALIDIESATDVVVVAVRHQLEDDYY